MKKVKSFLVLAFAGLALLGTASAAIDDITISNLTIPQTTNIVFTQKAEKWCCKIESGSEFIEAHVVKNFDKSCDLVIKSTNVDQDKTAQVKVYKGYDTPEEGGEDVFCNVYVTTAEDTLPTTASGTVTERREINANDTKFYYIAIPWGSCTLTESTKFSSYCSSGQIKATDDNTLVWVKVNYAHTKSSQDPDYASINLQIGGAGGTTQVNVGCFPPITESYRILLGGALTNAMYYTTDRYWRYDNDNTATTVKFYSDAACTTVASVTATTGGETTQNDTLSIYTEVFGSALGRSLINTYRVQGSPTQTTSTSITGQHVWDVEVGQSEKGETEIELEAPGEAKEITCDTPVTAADGAWKVSSFDETIATVTTEAQPSDTKATLKVTGLKPGTTEVYASNGILEYTLTVTVKDPPPQPVSVEVNQPLTYNGLIQTGVVENAGYTLTGAPVGTNAVRYIAIATLNPGYYWANGSENSYTNIFWTIAPKPVTVSAVDCEKVYGTADPDPLPATIVGTNGFDGAVIHYDIDRDAGEKVGTYDIMLAGVDETQGNYLVSFGDKTTATFAIKWADPYPLVINDIGFTVKVTRVWLERNKFDQAVKDPDDLSETLKSRCNTSDTYTMWQKYLININTNNGFHVYAPDNLDPNTVSIIPFGIKDKSRAEPVDEATCGVKVQFRLDRDGKPFMGPQDGTTFAVPLDGNQNSSNYLVNVVYTQNGRSCEQACREYLGILMSEPYTTSGGAREFVAVPWNDYLTRSIGFQPTNVVKRASLLEGDMLYFSGKTNTTRDVKGVFQYDAWVLDANKEWQPITAIGIEPNGCWSNRVNSVLSEETRIKYGGALWLERQDATKGVVFVGHGRPSGRPVGTTKKQVYDCSPIGIGELDIRTLKYGKGARIIIPTPGAPIIWTYDGANWSSKEQYVDGNGIVRTRERTDSVIKPGRGYWLDRTADESLK